jgi:hypothetical protein
MLQPLTTERVKPARRYKPEIEDALRKSERGEDLIAAKDTNDFFKQLGLRYVTDKTGRKKEVLLSLKSYNALIERIEDLEDIRDYEAAKRNGDKSIPMEEAFAMLDAKRTDTVN